MNGRGEREDVDDGATMWTAVLAIERATFPGGVDQSPATAEELNRAMRERLAMLP